MPEVNISIGGRLFEVACQEGEQRYLEAAARMLDREAAVMTDQLGRMPESRMLLMAGLMLADKTAGLEDRIRDLIRSEADGLFDEITQDPMGTLLCRRDARKGRKDGTDPLRIMLLCHMDEIGFLVSHVSDKGFIHVVPVGGFDPRNLFSRRVLVCTAQGDFKGVMNPGGPPVHISSP